MQCLSMQNIQMFVFQCLEILIQSFQFSKIQNLQRSGSFYKSCMENASKHFENDEGEDDFFVLWFYTVVSYL